MWLALINFYDDKTVHGKSSACLGWFYWKVQEISSVKIYKPLMIFSKLNDF